MSKVTDVDTGAEYVLLVSRYEKNRGGFVMLWQDEIVRLLARRMGGCAPATGLC